MLLPARVPQPDRLTKRDFFEPATRPYYVQQILDTGGRDSKSSVVGPCDQALLCQSIQRFPHGTHPDLVVVG